MTATQGERLATDLRTAYEWHDRDAFEGHLKRLITLMEVPKKCSDCPLLQREMHQNTPETGSNGRF